MRALLRCGNARLLTLAAVLTIRPVRNPGPGSKVVMQGTANPLYGGSIPPPASIWAALRAAGARLPLRFLLWRWPGILLYAGVIRSLVAQR